MMEDEMDLLTLVREAIDEAVEAGWSKARIVKELRDAIEEVEADEDIPK